MSTTEYKNTLSPSPLPAAACVGTPWQSQGLDFMVTALAARHVAVMQAGALKAAFGSLVTDIVAEPSL